MKVSRFFFLLVLFVVTLDLVFSDEQYVINENDYNKVTQLNSNWYLIPNDEPTYRYETSVNSLRFSDQPTDTWKNAVSDLSDYEGIGWYTLSFSFEKSFDLGKIGLGMPMCYGDYQLYLNGELIYETVGFDKQQNLFGTIPIVLELPQKLIKKDNYLSIRIRSYNGWGGFSSNGLEIPFIKIGPYSKVISQWARFVIEYSAISFICIFLFIFFLFRYYLRRKDKYNLHFALFSLSVGVFLMGFYGFWYYIYYKSWVYWILTVLGGINMYLMPILFLHSFFDIKKKIVAKVFTWFYLGMNLIVLFEFVFTGDDYFFIKYIYNFFNLSYVFLVLYLIIFGVRTIIRKFEYANIMFIGIVFLGFSFLYSMLTFTGLVHNTPLIGEGFFAMIVVFSFVLAKRFAKTHSDLELTHNNLVFANNEIKELNESLEIKVENRTQELKEKNREITESIEYAGLIQHTMLPTSEDLNEVFAEHFTIWQPKNIVGGDLYWLYKLDDGFLFAALDCTGHGVPGALLSMSAASSLDHIVRQMGLRNPAEILKNLNNTMKNQLNQGDSSAYTDDGLEISLIRYTTGRKTLEFAGSRLRLLVLEDGTFTEFQGSRKGIGFKRTDVDQEFDLHQIDIKPNTTYFLATDGYIEQSGGPDSYMLGWKKYKSILAETEEDLAVVKEKLMNQFDQYRGDREQMDDVLVVGFRLDMVE